MIGQTNSRRGTANANPMSSKFDLREITVGVGFGAGITARTTPPEGLQTHASSNSALQRDQRLVYAAQAGCRTAFGELFNLYSRRIQLTIFSITKNSADAEDAMQDSFLQAFLAIRRFEGRANFYTWLTRIAINSSLMILRRRRARPEVSFNGPLEWEDELVPLDFEDSAPGPEETYDQWQRQSSLIRAIHRLSPNLREVVRVRVTEECSVREVADRFNISLAAAKSRLYRARRRLGVSRANSYGSMSQVAISRSSAAPQNERDYLGSSSVSTATLAEAVPSRARSLSNSVTRVLSVPKSTPATTLMKNASFPRIEDMRFS